MSEHRHYSGPDLATLLRRVGDELGSDAVIVKADRVRSGGMAGFFAREHYEVVAARPEIDVSTSPAPAPLPDGGDTGRADEPIGMKPVPAGLAPTLPALTPLNSPTATALTPASPGSVAPRPAAAAPRPGRSIQAALLDRADQVSTEELLAQASELSTAERGNESFRSILGRAVAGEPDPFLDSQTAANIRRDDPQVDRGPGRRQEPIIGLRPERVRPGETVIDPLPSGPPDPESDPAPHDRPRRPETPRPLDETRPDRGNPGPAGDSYDPERDRARRHGDDRADWYSRPGHHPAPWPAHSGHYSAPWWDHRSDYRLPWPVHPGPTPPPWGSPRELGWTPWTFDGRSAPTQTARAPMPNRCHCPACSQPVPAPAIDSAVLVNSTPAGCHHVHASIPTAPGLPWSSGPEVALAWWELRREIDDAIRHRVDDIVRALRPAAADQRCDCGASMIEPTTAGDRQSIGDRPPPPARTASGRPAPDRRRPVGSVIGDDHRNRRPGRAVDDHPRRNPGERW